MSWDRVQALLFDLDGVLIDSAALVLGHWRRFASWYGLPVDTVLGQVHGARARDVVKRVLADRDGTTIATALHRHERLELEHVDGVVALAGARQLLGSLRSEQWAIVTSATSEVARRRLAAAGLPAPGTLVGAEQLHAGKPSPEGYLTAAGELKADVARCVVIEDAPVGVAAGRAAGAFVIAVTTTHAASQLAAAHATIENLGAVSASPGPDGIRLRIER